MVLGLAVLVRPEYTTYHREVMVDLRHLGLFARREEVVVAEATASALVDQAVVAVVVQSLANLEQVQV
jgi:hypothetical protein